MWMLSSKNSSVPCGTLLSAGSGVTHLSFQVWEGQQDHPGAEPLWPAACRLGWNPLQGHTGLRGQTGKFFLSTRKISYPQNKGQGKGRGPVFLDFLIKCHLLPVNQPSVSRNALGQSNI